MAAQVILVEARPRLASGLPAPIVRLAGGGADLPYRYPDAHGVEQDWRSGIVALPTVITSLDFAGDDLGTGAVPQATQITWSPAVSASLDVLAGYFWIDAPIVVRAGPEGVSPPVILAGKVLEAATEPGKLTISLADPAADLKKPLLTDRYAGTGGLEGPPEWSGLIKPRLWGRVWNVQGQPIDKANNIYALADPLRPLQAIDGVRDKGAPASALTIVAWQGTAGSTFAALQAAVAPQGGGVVCPSIACVKWWTQPAGDLNADLRGEIATGYVETAPSIAERLVQAVAGPSFAAGTVASAAAARPAPVGWMAKDETTTVSAMLDALLGGVSLLWVLDPAGAIALRKWEWGESVTAARSQQVGRKAVFRPVAARKLGYRRNELQMGRGDLASTLR